MANIIRTGVSSSKLSTFWYQNETAYATTKVYDISFNETLNINQLGYYSITRMNTNSSGAKMGITHCKVELQKEDDTYITIKDEDMTAFQSGGVTGISGYQYKFDEKFERGNYKACRVTLSKSSQATEGNWNIFSTNTLISVC